MDTENLKRISRNVFRVIVLSFVVMCLGSYVRSNDAGLSCPDWPLCYGQLVPLFDFSIFLEWFHRLLAGLLAFNLIYLLYLIVREKEVRQAFGAQIFAAGVLLLVQIILGGLTVLQLIDPGIVSLHLINAVLFFGVLILLYAKAERLALPQLDRHEVPPTKGVFIHGLAVLVLLTVQIFVGGMVSTNFAGTVCPDFPTCFGHWWPGNTFLIGLQMTHRYLAFAFMVLVLSFSVRISRGKFGIHTRRASRLLPALVIGQIGLGVVNVFYSLPNWSSLLHLANAILMFGITCLASAELGYAMSAQDSSSSAAFSSTKKVTA